MCARRSLTRPKGGCPTAKDVVRPADVARPSHAVGHRQWRHGGPGVSHDVVAVVVSRTDSSATVAAHQVDELPGNGAVGRAFTHRRTESGRVPSVGHRVVFPSLALFGETAVEPADDINLAVARIVHRFGPDAGRRHRRACSPRVTRNIIDVGRVQDSVVVAAEHINLIDVGGVSGPRIVHRFWHVS